MPSDHVTNLQKAIHAMHHCDSRYVESVPVTEKFQDRIAWAGVVDVFDLFGHPTANRAYAWSWRDGAQTKFVAVLEAPPVDSPESAVKITMAATGRSRLVKIAGVSRIKTLPSRWDIFLGLCSRFVHLDLNIDTSSAP